MNFKPESGNVYAIVFLFVAVFIAHYLSVSGYGLYEDDYMSARYVNADLNLWDAARNLYTDTARPVGRFLRYGLTAIGAQMGGLVSIYLIGYLILCLNTVLVYLILRNITNDHLVPVVGALVYCLYPADTTKILLTHSLQLQLGMLLSLFGIHLYQKGRRVIPYVLAILSLLTYESSLLPLLAAPFLKQKIEKGVFREELRHGAIIVALVLIALVARYLIGEARVSGLSVGDPVKLVTRIWSAMALGPLASSSMFFYRPFTALREGGAGAWFVMAAFFTMTFLFLRTFAGKDAVDMDEKRLSTQARHLPFQVDLVVAKSVAGASKLLLTGLVFWAVSYMFAFSDDHYPPLAIEGRMTSVHLASTFAASLTLAGLVWFGLIYLKIRNWSRAVFVGVISVYFSLLAGFSYVVQKDYVRSWNYQKEFWKPVIALVPDITKDSAVFYSVRNADFKQTKYVLSHSWGDWVTLESLYDFGGHRATRFNYLRPEMAKSFRMKNGKLHFQQPLIGGGFEEAVIDPRDMILLFVNDKGELERARRININGIDLDIGQKSKPTSLAGTRIQKLILQDD